MLNNILSLFPCITALNLLCTDPDFFGFCRLSIYILKMQNFLLKSLQIILEVLAKTKFATGYQRSNEDRLGFSEKSIWIQSHWNVLKWSAVKINVVFFFLKKLNIEICRIKLWKLISHWNECRRSCIPELLTWPFPPFLPIAKIVISVETGHQCL